MKNIIFHIISHPALEIDENYKIVNEFINKRINYFYPDAIVVFDDMAGLIKMENNVVIELLSVNPLFDPDIINSQIDLLEINKDRTIKSKGHIPGSEPERVYYSSSSTDQVMYIKSDKQQIYNSQFNLNKLKRQKHFKDFLKIHERFYEFTLEDFFTYIESEKGINDYLKFGENVDLEVLDKCPYCFSDDLEELHYSSSQPTNGFVTKNISIYSKCRTCDLVFLTRMIKQNDLYRLYDDYMQEFAFHRLLDRTTHHIDEYHMYSKIVDFLQGSNQSNLVDLGSGTGEFLMYAKSELSCNKLYGIDFTVLKEDKELLKKHEIDIIEGDLIESIDMIKDEIGIFTCWEVIEHLHIEDLVRLFNKVHSKLSNGGYFIFSTPDYQNQICRLFDFGLAAPIQHLTILSENWLDRFLKSFRFVTEKKIHGNMMLRNNSWSSYAEETSPTIEGKNIANIFSKILNKSETRNRFLSLLYDCDLGSEIIYIISKK